MKNSTVKNISEILGNSTLARIVRQANELNELNARLQQLLPQTYAGLYRLINLSDNQLTIDVQNATVRQGLLLQQSYLVSLIQRDFPQITELKLRVNPNFKAR